MNRNQSSVKETMEIGKIEWQEFQHLFKKETVPAKTILLHEGEISKNAYFIEKGCLRSWFNHQGTDITFQFFMEGQFVSSIESFKTSQPSLFNIETIEPSVVHSITKSHFQSILDQSPEIEQQVERLTFERLYTYQKLFLSRIKDKPEKRYLDLIESNPEIVLRVPQHYIASFLGITPVSLSRIRNRKL